MHKKLNDLSEIIAKANDVFFQKFANVDTVMGIMDKSLRKQGIKADAITLDCLAQNKKIVFVLHDDKPNEIDVALGDKDGAIHSSSSYQYAGMTTEVVVEIMQTYFSANH